MKKDIHVVGAIIEKDGKILCAQRSLQKSLPGLWEFPGGKIEKHETPRQALARELEEELHIQVDIAEEAFNFAVHEYDFGIVHFTTFICKNLQGEIELTEHEAIKWLPIDQLETLEWPPVDQPAVKKLIELGEV